MTKKQEVSLFSTDPDISGRLTSAAIRFIENSVNSMPAQKSYHYAKNNMVRSSMLRVLTSFIDYQKRRSDSYLPDVRSLDLKIYLSKDNSKMDKNREYFEFEGSNLFSWNSKKVSEDQRKALYQMIVDNIIRGVLVPKQKLPEPYHNLVFAEAIKGNRNKTVLKYLEIK